LPKTTAKAPGTTQAASFGFQAQIVVQQGCVLIVASIAPALWLEQARTPLTQLFKDPQPALSS